MYVYIQSEPGLWTVGFYDPKGKWIIDSDQDSREAAAERVAWLNGAQVRQQITMEYINAINNDEY